MGRLTMHAVRPALLAAFFALAAGCAGSGDGTRLYVLSPTAGTASAPTDTAVATANIAVVVATVRVPQYLDRPQLVTRSSGHRLQIAEFDQWAGDLREDLTRVLADNLSRALGSTRVVAVPQFLRAPAAARVQVELLAFERMEDGRVRLAARWWVTRGAEAAPIEGTRMTELFGAPLGDKPTAESTVASMSQVYGEFSRGVAAAIRGEKP
jgi:uncharacterized lipoprotein YmbA